VFSENNDVTDDVINEMIDEVDYNGQGEIDFKDFKDMMLSIQRNEII
jgi:Ca2+-binding EF-hand superfamily protein